MRTLVISAVLFSFMGFFAECAPNRITNGHDATPGEAPFLVSLRDNDHFCGGAIINPHWIVTAAHCLFQKHFYVVAGLHFRNILTDTQIRSVRSFDQQIVHEKFSGVVGPYDIGLIYLTEPFELNETARIGSIALSTGEYKETGCGAIYGWGGDNSGNMADTLQTLETFIVDHEVCSTAFPFPIPFTELNICAYNFGTSDGTCGGDSGGPLVRNTPAGLQLIGTVSFGYSPCTTTKYPSVFSRVSAYKDWIAEKMANFQYKEEPSESAEL